MMKLRFFYAALVGLAVAAGLFLLNRPAAEPAALPAPSATVSFMQPSRQVVPLRIEGAGSVVAGVAQTDVILAATGIITGFTVHPGEAVMAGQAMADVMPDAQSVAVLRKAQDAVDAANLTCHHVAALLAQHLATNADLAAANQSLQDAEADVAALRASGTGLQRHVEAPFAGLVTAISASAGSLLPPGSTVLQIAPASGLSIQAGLREAGALQVRPGDAATITLLNTGARLRANVSQRAGMLDPQTGLMDVTLLPLGAVTLGEPVSVTITAGSFTGIPVPRAAVLSDAQGDYVFLLDRQNIAHRQNVQVLESDGGNSVLAPNFDVGMRLATIGAYQLSDGMTATLQAAAP